MKNKPYFTERETKLLLRFARITFNINSVYLITNEMILKRKHCLCMDTIVNFVIAHTPRIIPPTYSTLRKKCYLDFDTLEIHPELGEFLNRNRTWLSE